MDIEPCPFCGGVNVHVVDYKEYVRDVVVSDCEDAYYDYEDCFSDAADDDGGYIVICKSRRGDIKNICWTKSGWYPTIEAAVSAWNSRPVGNRTAVVYKRKKGE